MRNVQRSGGLILALLAACSSLDSAPARLDGSWGGTDARLMASSDTIRLVLSCSSWSFVGPVGVGSDGRFAMDGVGTSDLAGGVRDTIAPGHVPIHIDGRIVGRTMTISLFSGAESTDPAPLATFRLTLGRSAVVLPTVCRD